jgi:hypothetical protein
MRNPKHSILRWAARLAFALTAIGALNVIPARAQNFAADLPQTEMPVSAKAPDEMEKRIQMLESQLARMRAELESLKKAVGEKTEAKTPTDVTSSATPLRPPPADTQGTAATPAKTQQQQTPKQIGFDLGSVRVVPYGTIYFNAFNNTGAVNNQDVPMFAVPSGQGGASASVRQTRLGMRFEGAKVGAARLSGVIEADFFGGFPSVGIGENFGIVRLRLANVKAEWEKTSVTAGQDWMPFAPVNPVSIASAAIPQLAAAGNNWARIPQVRVDHKLNDNFTLTGSVLAPQTGDYPATSFLLQTNSGSSSRVPFLQSRLAYADSDWWGTKKAGSIGVSGHYGRSRVFTGANNISHEVDSTGLALDWNFPLHARVTLAGEAFFGRDLGGFQAGVFQSVNTDFAYRSGATVTPAGVRAIGTRGGWVQLGFTPDVFADKWSLYGSVGIDDPRDEDLTSVARLNFRSRNLAFAFNTIYKVTPQFSLGAEFRRFRTGYMITGPRTSNHVNLGAAYSF